ncbi:MAG: hypothetical protein AB7W16_26565 [Candidatus Obscuribacterales bacterium]
MHDCPTCRVPLHGHEEVCPSCGTRQRVRRSTSSLLSSTPQKPPVNLVPFVIVFFVLGIGTFMLAQGSWVGQIMSRGPVQEDPLDKLSAVEIRQMLYSKIEEGIAAAGATATYTWATPAGEETDINAQGPVHLTINTELSDPNLRRGIIDPVKELMHKAQIPTLVMNDSRSKATWTYQVNVPATPTGAAAPADQAAPANQEAEQATDQGY